MGEIIEFNRKNESLKKKTPDIRCYCLSFGIKNDLTNFEKFYSNLKNVLQNKTINYNKIIDNYLFYSMNTCAINKEIFSVDKLIKDIDALNAYLKKENILLSQDEIESIINFNIIKRR